MSCAANGGEFSDRDSPIDRPPAEGSNLSLSLKSCGTSDFVHPEFQGDMDGIDMLQNETTKWRKMGKTFLYLASSPVTS